MVANTEDAYATLNMPIQDRIRIDAQRIDAPRQIERCSEARIRSEELHHALEFIEEFFRNPRRSALLIERQNFSQVLRGLRVERMVHFSAARSLAMATSPGIA